MLVNRDNFAVEKRGPVTDLRHGCATDGRILQIPGEQRHAWSVFDGECAVARNVPELGRADAHRSLDAALAAEYLRVETVTEPDDHDLLQDAQFRRSLGRSESACLVIAKRY